MNSLIRYFNFHTPMLFSKSIFLTEYPKSGGTWISNLIACYHNIDFPRNSFPNYLQANVYHGHYLGSAFSRRQVILVRDIRDVYISMWFHYSKSNAKHDENLRAKFKNVFPKDTYDLDVNTLDLFIDLVDAGKIYPRYNWSVFVSKALKSGRLIVRYEDFLQDPAEQMLLILKYLNSYVDMNRIESCIDEFSFVKLTGRERGEENNSQFLRKGIAGDWKNYFTDELNDKIIQRHGSLLRSLDYEK